jgi:tetratricopeptide (TPR) repeat protein
VELSAARTSVLSPTQILERLSQRLDLLKGGRDTEARQRTLRATIEWSYELLDEEERRLFARLAVFAGGCTLESAEEVAEAELDTLQSLVDKSLLRHTEERLWMLETIREYALERLEHSGEAEELGQRHAEHILALAQKSRRLLRGSEQKTWLRRMLAEEGNIRAALTWAVDGPHAEIALRLAFGLEVFWVRAVRQTEAARWLDLVLRFDDPAQPILRARALATGGIFAATPEVAARRFAESIPVLRELEDEDGLAFALRGVAWLHLDRGELAEARASLKEAVELFTKLGHAVTTRLADLGTIALKNRDAAGARQWFERALAAAHDEEDTLGATSALQGLGELALASDELGEAECRFCEALRTQLEFKEAWAAESIRGLAEVAIRRGAFEQAGRLWTIAERIAKEGDPSVWPMVSKQFASKAEALAPAERLLFEHGRAAGAARPIDAARGTRKAGAQPRSLPPPRGSWPTTARPSHTLSPSLGQLTPLRTRARLWLSSLGTNYRRAARLEQRWSTSCATKCSPLWGSLWGSPTPKRADFGGLGRMTAANEKEPKAAG